MQKRLEIKAQAELKSSTCIFTAHALRIMIIISGFLYYWRKKIVIGNGILYCVGICGMVVNQK